MPSRLATCWSPIAVLVIVHTITVVAAESKLSKIEWTKSPEAALTASRQDDRPILVYFTTTDCVFCRKMERHTWKDGAVVKVVRESFVPLRIDAEDHPDIVQRLGINAFPTTIVLTPDGQLVSRFEGFLTPKAFVKQFRREPAADDRASDATE